MNKGAVIYIIKLFIQKVLGILVFLLGSSGYLGTRAAVYFGFYLIMTAVSNTKNYYNGAHYSRNYYCMVKSIND